jgi:DNA repair exonuclease SbcCD ATPase subunit
MTVLGFVINEIKLHNYRSYEGTHAISFPLGITVIDGGTGEGKTGLISALNYGVKGMEGVPGKKKNRIPFAGGGGENSCWVEVEFDFGGKFCRIGRELWRDPETGRFRQNLTLREGDVVLGGMEAQKRIDELMLPERLDLLIINGKDLAAEMLHFRRRRSAIEAALGKPDLVRARDLARRAQPFFSRKYQDELSAMEAAKVLIDAGVQLSEFAQRIEAQLNQPIGTYDLGFVKLLRGVGEVKNSEVPELAMKKLEKIEKDVTELRTKSGEWLQILRAEVARERRSLEERHAEDKKELERRDQEATLLRQCSDIAHRAEAAFENILKMFEEEKHLHINKGINEMFSAISSKPTFGNVGLTPDYELIVEELGSEYSPDQVRPSSGEQDALALSFLFALSKVASGAQCLVLDNPVIHFDQAYKERFRKWLPKLGFQQVIVFTNDPDFKEMPEASQVIEILMEDGRSKMNVIR